MANVGLTYAKHGRPDDNPKVEHPEKPEKPEKTEKAEKPEKTEKVG